MLATATCQLVSLAEVLTFRHAGVVRRYADEHHTSRAEAEDVFEAMLRWLYLCYRSALDGSEGFAVSMTLELKKVDSMWHTFILFARDYAAFCEQHIGLFLHHVPEVEEEADETPADDDTVRANLKTQLGLIYDVLGEETLTKWYVDCRYAVAD